MPEKKTEGVSLRVMPNSYEAEQAVLAAMLLDNEKCSEFLPGLSEDDFYAVAHKKIFKVITELARESGASVDAIAVMSRLNRKGELDAVGGAGAIEALTDSIASTANAQYYFSIVKRDGMLRTMIRRANAIVERAYSDDNVDSVRAFAEAQFFDLGTQTAEGDLQHVSVPMAQLMVRLNDVFSHKKGAEGLRSGFNNLDNLLNGFLPGQIIIVAARPGLGKTAFALNVVSNVLKNDKKKVVAVFNLIAMQEKVWGVLPSKDLPDSYLLFLNASNTAVTVKLGNQTWENIPFLDVSSGKVDTEHLPDAYCTMGSRVILVDETKGMNQDISYLFTQGNYFSYNAETEELSGLYTATTGYIGIVGESLYSYEGKSGVAIQIDPVDSGFSPEKNGRYLLHGELFDSGSSNRAMAITDFYEGCEESPWVKFESYDDPVLHEGIFAEYAEKYRMGNNYIRVDASDDIGALEPFQQGTLYLLDGRFPTPGELDVCVVGNDIAEELDLKVGDSLPLSMMQATEQDPFALEETGETQNWTVVGIANQTEGYEGRVWVSRGQKFPQTALFGYQLGRAVLDNDLAAEAVDQMQSLVPDGVRITLFDQGYSAAAQPLQAMESTAQGVTFASLVGVVAVLFLFAFLFVGRQQQAVDVMTSLGTPKGKIRLWLLSGATLVCGVAVLSGVVISAVSMQLMVRLVLNIAEAFYAADQRYSNGALGMTKEAEMVQQLPLWPSLVAGLVVSGSSVGWVVSEGSVGSLGLVGSEGSVGSVGSEGSVGSVGSVVSSGTWKISTS